MRGSRGVRGSRPAIENTPLSAHQRNAFIGRADGGPSSIKYDDLIKNGSSDTTFWSSACTCKNLYLPVQSSHGRGLAIGRKDVRSSLAGGTYCVVSLS